MENPLHILMSYLNDQNPVMLALYGLSVLCLAAVIDRLFFWLGMALRYQPIPPQAAQPGTPAGEIIKRQLLSRRCRHYRQEILLTVIQNPQSPAHLKQTVSEQIERMSARVGMLDLIAKTAPLVGILGTVIGMAVSFGGISQIVTASPAMISLGISMALKTTAWGLVISLMASLSAAVFRKFNRNATLKMGRLICELGYAK